MPYLITLKRMVFQRLQQICPAEGMTQNARRSPGPTQDTRRHAALLLAGTALLAAGCAPTLDTEAIALSIQTDLEEQGDIEFEKVICPDDLEPLVGQTFRCWGKLSEDEFFPIDVEQLLDVDETNVATAVDWHIPTSRAMLNLAELELEFQDSLVAEISEEIEQELDMPIQVNCGAVYRVNTPGETFTCQIENSVIIDARRLDNVQVNLDSQGNVNWQSVRNLVPPEELEAAEAEGIAFESVLPEEGEDGEESDGVETESTDQQAAADNHSNS